MKAAILAIFLCVSDANAGEQTYQVMDKTGWISDVPVGVDSVKGGYITTKENYYWWRLDHRDAWKIRAVSDWSSLQKYKKD